MALDTYSALKTSIADWLHRADLSLVVDDFIDLAESDFNRELRLQEQETASTFTPSGDVVALPADYLEMRRITLLAATKRELRYLTPAAYNNLGTVSGEPYYYTITKENVIVAGSTAVEFLYWKEIVALSAGNPTNFLLTRWPNLYLQAGVHYGEVYIKKKPPVDFADTAEGQAMLEAVRRQDRRARFSGASMEIRVG